MRLEIEQRRKKDQEQTTRLRDLDSQCKIQQRVIRQQHEELKQLRAFKAFSVSKGSENVAADLRRAENEADAELDRLNAGGKKAETGVSVEPASSVFRAEQSIILLEQDMA